jgi:hypothetical protein
VDAVTAVVVIENVALLLPVATLTVPGTEADALLLESETETPLAGAGPLRVIVPVAEVPPVTLAGLIESDESVTPSFDVSDRVTVDLADIATLS